MKFLRTWKLYRLRLRLAKLRAKDAIDRLGETTRQKSCDITQNYMRIQRLEWEIKRLED